MGTNWYNETEFIVVFNQVGSFLRFETPLDELLVGHPCIIMEIETEQCFRNQFFHYVHAIKGRKKLSLTIELKN